MKNLIRIGGTALLLIIVSLFWIWRPTSNDTTQPSTKITEENDMNTQTTSLPETKQQGRLIRNTLMSLRMISV